MRLKWDFQQFLQNQKQVVNNEHMVIISVKNNNYSNSI